MFIHLHVHSVYSFLDGASEIEALVRRAAEMGMPALALTDHNSLAGAVRFVHACQQYAIAPILGSELTMEDGSHLTLLAQDRTGYANLCRLTSLAHEHGGRRTPALSWDSLPAHAAGLICLSGCRRGRVPALLRARRFEEAVQAAREMRDWFGEGNFFLELQDDLTPDSQSLCRALADLGQTLGIGVVATGNVHYAEPQGHVTHDVLRCIQVGVTLASPHQERPLNAERYLKSASQMQRLFAWCPEALANTYRIAERCTSSGPGSSTDSVLPADKEITPRHEAEDAPAHLRALVYNGAKQRYGRITSRITERLEHELSIITTLGFADYLLLCHDIVQWARSQRIRCTGRGSAADSCVAYCLYLTDVDVIRRGLPFARFLMPGKTPDVDCDFPSDRRDEVFRHIQKRYGEENVGMACTFFTYHARGAVRDVGKVLALPPDTLSFLSERLHHFLHADEIEAAFETFPELKEQQHLRDRFHLLFELCGRIAGFPRHIGTHSSGVVISRVPLTTIAPLIPSAKGVLPIWTLDKDDSEAVGGIKFDVLSLRVLSSVADAETDIEKADPAFRYEAIPDGDPATYQLLQSGKAIGVFQFESAAQLSLSVSLLPSEMEDLVAAVALIRPGPIRGNVVQRYVNARNGWARVEFLHPCLVPILTKTFGCIVFQEQVDLCIAAMTGCRHEEAERFRKSLVKHEQTGTMSEAREVFVERACAFHPDLPEENAHRLFTEIEGWSGYGFIEGHAASFALTGYRTAFLSVHYAAEYFAGLLNHQPMGYYSPNSLVGEARRRGVTILPVDINLSDDKCHADGQGGLRLGLRLVERLGEADRETILTARQNGSVSGTSTGGPFVSLLDFCVRVVLARDRLENLILCGAFDGLHRHRRRGLLLRLDETLSLAHAYRAQVQQDAGQQRSLPFGSWQETPTPMAMDIAEFSDWDRFRWAWRITGVCADAHPMARYRRALSEQGVITTYDAQRQPPRTQVTVAGLNIRPHRPPTRSGRTVLFTTLEDETDLLQVVCTGEALDKYTALFLLSPVVQVTGSIEHRGRGASLLVEHAEPLCLSLQ